MYDLGIILRSRLRAMTNNARSLRHESRLKVGFITLFALAFWAALFEGFREAFVYISQVPGFENLLVGLLFSLFFLSLLVMLVFSNAILAYGSLYRSGEVDFLLTLPVRQETIFLYKLIETVFYSSWAFLYLGVPIVAAFGWQRGGPWYFYPAAIAMFCMFVAIPAAAGCLIAVLLVSFVPKSRMKVLAVLGAVALAATVVVSIRQLAGISPGYEGFGYGDLTRLLGRLSFSQNPFLPSLWLSRGVLSLARAQTGGALFYALVILSNSLFFTALAGAVSGRLFWRSFSRSRSSGARESMGSGRILPAVINAVFFFLPRDIRLFLTKDTRIFLRDRLQWSQMLIFFGVLAIYIANIRSLPYDLRIEHARSGISLLNLAATCLVLSTFTGRFIFPLLSLEGRNFWVLGLAPVKRSRILYGKFVFAFAGSLILSESLILLSDFMLGFPAVMWFGHAVLVAAICAGLSAISVGLGARYPNLKEDNPARIVAGFGGTLNLIVSMLYIAVMVATIGVAYHFAFAARETNPAMFVKIAVVSLALSVGIGTLVSVFFLNVGRAEFDRIEL